MGRKTQSHGHAGLPIFLMHQSLHPSLLLYKPAPATGIFFTRRWHPRHMARGRAHPILFWRLPQCACPLRHTCFTCQLYTYAPRRAVQMKPHCGVLRRYLLGAQGWVSICAQRKGRSGKARARKSSPASKAAWVLLGWCCHPWAQLK